ncbi:hypothetical protein LTR94_034594, partial [Friedmanniomyces endolithicus]
SDLAQYAGIYALAPSFELAISVSELGLSAQATGQNAVDLAAEGHDAFFLASIDAQIVFTRDILGEVDGLILRQGGREMRAQRK